MKACLFLRASIKITFSSESSTEDFPIAALKVCSIFKESDRTFWVKAVFIKQKNNAEKVKYFIDFIIECAPQSKLR
jgi:hypothetical protein